MTEQELSDQQKLKTAIWNNIHLNFTPHAGQVVVNEQVLRPPYGKGVRRTFVRAGRNFGKSTDATYLAHMFALYNPGFRCYVLAPLYKQAKEIYWASNLLPNFLDVAGAKSPFISKIDQQDTRIEYFNGSFIKVDGSDNYDSARGWKPDFVAGDEFGNFDPRWFEVMVPNLQARNATLFLIGTPPRNPELPNGQKHQYVQLDEEFQKRQAEGKDVFWYYAPSHVNSVLYSTPEGKQALADEEQRLTENNERYVWEREYLALIVSGGKHAIFPTFDKAKHLAPYDSLIDLIYKDPERFSYYCIADPGTKSTFAVLFIAYDSYSATPYLINSIYETDPYFCSVDSVMPKIITICNSIYPNIDKWTFAADSAAAWWIQEALDRYSIYFVPTEKRVGDKDEGISTIRDILSLRTGFIATPQCDPLTTELVNYATDTRGNYIKENDHLIDCFRYFLNLVRFVLNERIHPSQAEKVFKGNVRPPRGYSSSTSDSNDDIEEITLMPDYEYLDED